MTAEINEPAVYRRRGFGWTRSLNRAWDPVDALGRQFHFVWMALRGVGHALRKHRRQTTEIFTDRGATAGRSSSAAVSHPSSLSWESYPMP